MSKYTKRNKTLIRSDLSGKVVNGKSVILTEEAIEYVKQMGYEVSIPPLQQLILEAQRLKMPLIKIGVME